MRVYTVKKARKEQGHCDFCHEPIEAGQGYRYIEPRTGPKRKRHLGCQMFRQSDMTGGKMSGVYRAQEDFNDFLGAWDGEYASVESALDEAASAIEEVADEYEESARNIEDGFGHSTYQSEELEEKASDLHDWAETVRDALSGVEDNQEEPSREDFEDDDEYEEAVEEARTQWEDEVRSAAEDAIGDCPC